MTENEFSNPDDARIRALLERARTVAVVGLSGNAGRPSFGVARALQGFGYRIIPVNPNVDEVLGERAVDSVADLPVSVDIVDVFRRPEHVAGIVDQAIAAGVPALWLQEGVVDRRAARRAVDAGITVVMDRCMYKEYNRLMT